MKTDIALVDTTACTT